MGYIYKIQCHDEFYIGSTVDLKQRLREHKSNCNNINDSKYNLNVYQKIRENNIHIKLIELEEVAGLDGEELKILEQDYIDRLKPELNMLAAYLSPERKLEAQKVRDKEYHKNNRDDILLKKKVRYNKNKVEINEKKKKDIATCECGCNVRRTDLPRHKRTKKHLKLIGLKLM